ncbi:MAG: hypothetical protein AAGA17_04965 [Actinomycetota bacterium]
MTAIVGLALVTTTLASPAAGSPDDVAMPDGAISVPADGVLFGEPHDEGRLPLRGERPVADAKAVIAEYEVGDGTVRFIDEGDGVATVITGDAATFTELAEATTYGELFELVAPSRTPLPPALRDAADDELDVLAGTGLHARAIDEEIIEEEHDPWADGCTESFGNWYGEYLQWRNAILIGGHAMWWGEHLHAGEDPDPMFGYFGNRDEIWFATCLREGVVATVNIEHWDGDSYVPLWQTGGTLSVGELYAYHSNAPYTALRRVQIRTIGVADYNPYEFYMAASARDTFEPDEQWNHVND